MNPEGWNPNAQWPQGSTEKNFYGEYAAETLNVFYEQPEADEAAEATECFSCQIPFEKSGSYLAEDGTVRCKHCSAINYPQPLSRKRMGVKYPNLDPARHDDYDFYITEVEAFLAKRRHAETQRALEWAEKAIALSPRTPDAYLYKALCDYYLTKPRSRLISNSAAHVIASLETAKRQCEAFPDYKPYRVMRGVIAGRYFRALEFSIKRILESLSVKRSALQPNGGYFQPPSSAALAEIESLERALLKHLRQFSVCFDLFPNPQFLQREVEYYYGHNSRFHRVPAPVLSLRIKGDDWAKYPNINDLRALQPYLAALQAGQYSICCGTEDVGQGLAQKTQRLRGLIPEWQQPEMRFYTPMCAEPLTLQETIKLVTERVERLKQEAYQAEVARQQKQAAYEMEQKQKLENEREAKRRKQFEEWCLIFSVIGVLILIFFKFGIYPILTIILILGVISWFF